MIDLIPSRECNDVAAWLKTYPNLKVISRDGSITYHNAITTAHPNVVQVSDRFHIIKNLASYCKEFLMKHFKAKITIDLPQATQFDVIETPDISVKDRKSNRHVKSSLELSHEEKLSQKQELIDIVRSMHEKECFIRSISKELQLSRPTVTRYLDEGVTAIHGSYSVKRKSILDPYIGDINVFLDKGYGNF